MLARNSRFGDWALRRRVAIGLVFYLAITVVGLPPVSADGGQPLLVRVGAYANPPKIQRNGDGRVIGFWPDLIGYIARQENWQLTYVWGTWEEGLKRLRRNEIDIMPDVAFTQERAERYLFSEAPVLMSWTRVYVAADNKDINSLLDLKGRKIAALKGSVNLEGPGGLREIARSFDLHCTFLELDDYHQVFRAI